MSISSLIPTRIRCIMLFEEDNMTIDCRKCKHYYVTWDPSNPMGCRKFNFKSRIMPSEVVFQSSGEPCRGFEPKQPAK